MRGRDDRPGEPPAVLDDRALALCRRTIARHSRSFSLAARLLPPVARDEAVVVYTWCRRADDAVDRAGPQQASRALAELRGELARIYEGPPPSGDVPRAFAAVVQARAIPRVHPEELLEGMRMDVDGTRYDTLDDLLAYCFRAAGTVGLMMCHVMGVRDEAALERAADLGIAMQLTNICRDVPEDWRMGRLYLPADLLADEGACRLADELGGPFPERARAPVARVIRRLLAVADRYYRSGDVGMAALSPRCALAVRTARLVYSAIGDRLADQGHDPFARRAVVPTPHKLGLVARAAAELAARR